MTIWSLVSCRIFDIVSTVSPGHGSTTGPCAPGPVGACIEGRGAVAAPDSRYCRMSLLVTLPAIPDPCIPAISTPCSAAIFRTSGDDLVRRRSSSELPLPPEPRTAEVGEGAAESAALAAAGALSGAATTLAGSVRAG